MSQAAAYRGVFDCQEGSLKETQQQSASRLMANRKVAAGVEVLQQRLDREMLASTVTDRERVLAKLRYFMDHALNIGNFILN